MVSNGLTHLNGKGPNAATAVLGKGSNAVAGGKMSPAAQKMSTIASTVASLQVIFNTKKVQQVKLLLIRPTKQYLLAPLLVLIHLKLMGYTKWLRLKSLIFWTPASKKLRYFLDICLILASSQINAL